MCIRDSGDAVSKNIKEIKPDAVIHCAAWTAVDAAEDEDKQEKVFAINSTGTENIAKVCKEIDVPMMYISTDYVLSLIHISGLSLLSAEKKVKKIMIFARHVVYADRL